MTQPPAETKAIAFVSALCPGALQVICDASSAMYVHGASAGGSHVVTVCDLPGSVMLIWVVVCLA
jgi:hypothetical protein